AEELFQAGLLRCGVPPALRLDADLAAECDGVDGLAARVEAEAEDERRHGGVRLHPDPEDGEVEPAHPALRAERLRARSRAKKSSRSFPASSPPSNPFQRRRTTPVSS